MLNIKHDNKTFRLFISSTFNDFRRERHVLQTKVFPNIKQYAAQRGYTFQPIDLRWGVSAEAQLDQKTLELCLDEVRTCKSHMHPNFLIMVGDRYGWVPLPYAIEQNEYETILSLVSSEEQNQLSLWYQLDKNQIPVSYILKERTDAYTDFKTWNTVEESLRKILQKSVKISSLTENQQRKYFLSATEAEVVEGIIPYLRQTRFQKKLLRKKPELEIIDPKHIFGFFRNIDSSTQIENKFIIDNDDYAKAQRFKNDIKKVIPEENRLEPFTRQIDRENLDESYLNAFEERVIAFLETTIDVQKEEDDKLSLTPLEIEQEAQRAYAQIKRKGFITTEPLERLLSNIKDYIANPGSSPAFVLYGPSGRGKSALMAQAISHAEETKHSKILYRFVGATPYSGSSKEILASIFEELGIDVRSEEEKREESDETSLKSSENKESFEDFSYRIHDTIMSLSENITIFIDAVDQLGNKDQFLWLPRELPTNIKIIISALDDENYPEDSQYFQSISKKTSNLHLIPEFDEPLTLLRNILKEEGRTLQPEQESYFLQQYASSQSPLYITIATQELRHWKSGAVGGVDEILSAGQKEIIQEFITNLENVYHHDPRFVRKVLGYLYASRDGLSESELLQLLNTDEPFIQAMAPETWHDNPTKELPLVHWSRLHTQLKPFLSLKSQDGEELMYFFHREFEDAVKTLPNQKEEHKAIIEATQKLITKYQHDPFDQNRWGKLYAILITEYELRFYSEEEQNQNYKLKLKQKNFSEFLSHLKNNDWIFYCLSHIKHIGDVNLNDTKLSKAIAYYESSLHASHIRCIEDFDHTSGFYAVNLRYLAIAYEGKKRIKEAMELLQNGMKITEILIEDYFYMWAYTHVAIIQSLSLCYNNVSDHKTALDMNYKRVEVAKKLFLLDPDNEEWKKSYIYSLNSLAGNCDYNNLYNEALEHLNKSLFYIEPLYNENQNAWMQLYTNALISLSAIYMHLDRIEEAFSAKKKVLDIRKSFFIKNPEIWKESYIFILADITNFQLNHKFTENLFELLEEGNYLIEPLYEMEPKYWAERYLTIIGTLADFFQIIYEDIDKSITYNLKSLKIIQMLYDHNTQYIEVYRVRLIKIYHFYTQRERYEDALNWLNDIEKSVELNYSKNEIIWRDIYNWILEKIFMIYLHFGEEANNRDCEPGMVGMEFRVDDTYFSDLVINIEKNLFIIKNEKWVMYETALSLYLQLIRQAFGEFKHRGFLEQALIYYKKSVNIREFLYLRNPDKEQINYITETIGFFRFCAEYNRLDFARQYMHNIYLKLDNSELIESFEQQYLIFKLSKNNLVDINDTSVDHILYYVYQAEHYLEISDDFYNIDNLEIAYRFSEKSLSIQKELYLVQHVKFSDSYALSCLHFANISIQTKDFNAAIEAYKIFFKIFDFSKSTNLIHFISPLIKWYQCEYILNNEKMLRELEVKCDELCADYIMRIDDSFPECIEEVYEDNYLVFKNSIDPSERQKFIIFEHIFLKYLTFGED